MKYIVSFLAITIISFFPSTIIAEESSTNPVDSIKQKVLEKIETVKNNPTAAMGSITDISQNSIQIKDGKGEIKLLSFDPDKVTIVNNLKKSASVKSNDLAIGDYIIAMGYINEKTVLDTKRILITTPVEQPKRSIIFATITDLSKKEITAKDKNGKETTFKFPSKWVGPEIKELETGYRVIIITESDDKNNVILRTIQIINKTNASVTPTIKDKSTPSPTKKASPTPTPK